MDSSHRAHCSIAVIDDDAPTRRLLDDLLREECYTVALWSGDDDPIAFVDAAAPDLVILDLHLGSSFRAWDVIDALCGDGPSVSVPVIVCSADGISVQRAVQTFAEHGCVIVEKPFDLDNLLDTIRQQLETHHAGTHAGTAGHAPGHQAIDTV